MERAEFVHTSLRLARSGQIGLTAPVYKKFSINTGVSFPVSFSKSHADLLESTTGQTPSINAPVNIITQTQLRASLIYKFGRIN